MEERERNIHIYTCIYITLHSVFVVAPVLNPHGTMVLPRLLSSVNVVANVGFLGILVNVGFLGILVYKKLMICNAICNYFIEHR